MYPSSEDSVTAQGIGTWILNGLDSSYVSESLVDTYFRYNYKPTSKKTLINKTDEIYSDETKFKGNAYANKKAFVSEKQWYYQAGIWTTSDGTKLECTGLKSSTQMQQYSLTYGSTTYKVSNVADLGSNDDILRTVDNEKANNVLLINPDNPTGHFLKQEDVLKLLDELKKRDVKLIFDESFIDFAEKEIRYTLINDEIIEKYPNLTVIKSITKSYGFPGLRLGVSSEFK